MHCSQNCSQICSDRALQCVTHDARRVALTGAALAQSPRYEGMRLPPPRRAPLTLFYYKHLNTNFEGSKKHTKAPFNSAHKNDTLRRGLTEGVSWSRSLGTKYTNPPGNSAPGQQRVETVEAEERRDTAQPWARPRGCTWAALLSIHESTVSSVPAADLPQLLTLPQAAQRLAICRRTLERMVARGEFPRPLRIAGATRVPASDVQSFIASLVAQRRSA